ncbi:hypothetical protein F2P56_034170 [Juglans regia]|uniref:Uncharacterized protein n=2 Tax=Juglans regia TaxID=51240 RepID=A0A833TQ31_JUGRE|nr:transcription factor TBF1-like [Juglans regia]KAF5445092.1 hypothetical protein F2P56_034170 [Juglans regia]
MGKKKSRKTKALSIAIAEASSTGDIDLSQQQAQPQTPRKRGRPRKIVERPDIQDKKEEEPVSDEAQVAARENQSKKVIMGAKEEQQEQQHEQHQQELQKLKGEGSSASMRGIKKEGNPAIQPLRSRARRKSKPRKSS